MVAEHKSPTFTSEQLRNYVWELGQYYPIKKHGDYVALVTQQPHQGCFVWNLEKASIDALQKNFADGFYGAAHVVRIYDVSDIEFDGHNAHSFFDVDVSGLSGNRFFHTDHAARLLMAEVGFRLTDGSFHALARSEPTFFDRPGSSGHFSVKGRFINPDGSLQFDVKNIFDAPVYERMMEAFKGSALKGNNRLVVVRVVYGDERLDSYVDKLIAHWENCGMDVQLLSADILPCEERAVTKLEAAMQSAKNCVREQWADVFKKEKFALVYAADLFSAGALLPLLKETQRPLVVSLREDTQAVAHASDQAVYTFYKTLERTVFEAASRVIVPHAALEKQIVNLCGVPAKKAYVIADVFEEQKPVARDPGSIKQGMHLHPAQPLALFSGEISHATGADLLMDAIFQIAGMTDLQFVFVGDGPLKGELEGRAGYGGLGHRVRFLGDVPADWFDAVLMASDFVVIPARTWQDEGLAQMAVHAGRPVLTTHQAHQGCIEHGQNGLVTYDNPGSMVWGLKEMLANPLQGNMLRIVARRNAEQGKTIGSAAVEHLICFAQTLAQKGGGA